MKDIFREIRDVIKAYWGVALMTILLVAVAIGTGFWFGSDQAYERGLEDAAEYYSAEPTPTPDPTPTPTPDPTPTPTPDPTPTSTPDPTPTSTPEPAPAEPELIEVPESVRAQLLTSAGTSKEIFFYPRGEEDFRNGHSIPEEVVDITLSLEPATYPVVGCYVLDENGNQASTGSITIEGSDTVIIRTLKEDTSYTIVLVYEAGFEMEATLGLM